MVQFKTLAFSCWGKSITNWRESNIPILAMSWTFSYNLLLQSAPALLSKYLEHEGSQELWLTRRNSLCGLTFWSTSNMSSIEAVSCIDLGMMATISFEQHV